jgi:hypothetical protein
MIERLGQGYELWDLARPKAAVHGRIAARMKGLTRDYDDDYIAYMLVDHLLAEVLNAAEGVERSFDAMKLHADKAQQGADEYFASIPVTGPPPIHHSWTEPATVNVWFEFVNLLVWSRTLEDRVKRRGMGQDPDQGLLPALASGALKKAVGASFRKFKAGHVAEARLFTNYGVHAGLLPNPGTPRAEVKEDGSLAFHMPDPIATPVDHWQEFTFLEHRDAFAFAEQLFREMATFIVELLDAFREAVPARFLQAAPATG